MSSQLVSLDSIVGRAHALAPAFQCSWADGGRDTAWVRLAGELDIATTPRLRRVLRALRARLVVLDLRELAFMDSSGVHAIVDASIRARRLGDRLLLLSGPPGVDRVFTLTASTDEILSGDIHAVEPSAEALMKLVEEGVVS
jgi:anti-sigma B factor antagonist